MAWKTQLERCVLETIERACADLIDYMYSETHLVMILIESTKKENIPV